MLKRNILKENIAILFKEIQDLVDLDDVHVAAGRPSIFYPPFHVHEDVKTWIKENPEKVWFRRDPMKPMVKGL